MPHSSRQRQRAAAVHDASRQSGARLAWRTLGRAYAVLAGAALVLPSHAAQDRTVVAYCAQDQVYAEPIFRDFEKQTGIHVAAVFDNEAVKTVGLANRLLAESRYPRCDVFWSNEELRTRQLAERNVLRPTNPWAAFGFRSRRIVINTNLVSLATAPHSLEDLTNAVWRGKLALANPQFGTTATHFHALRQHWGAAAWGQWCQALAANKPFLVDGNSVVVKFVGSGEAWLGLTDSDDIADGQREGLPVAELPLNPESLLIPNTVAVMRGAPHPQAAQRLFEYLQQRSVCEALIRGHALEGFSVDEVKTPTLKVNWPDLLRDLESTTATLNEIFLR
ncbi:MAG TPA: extracellular solute-binding protein [Verrucomicrobiae bacterium]|nr:extracellular solute-binding protein [Verrucomicrobiae bacterium]